MKIPIYLYRDDTADAVEVKWRDRIRRDRQIRSDLHSITVILFTHSVNGVVGVMYGTEYAKYSDEYDVTLNLLGFKRDRVFQALTVHAGKLRSVP